MLKEYVIRVGNKEELVQHFFYVEEFECHRLIDGVGTPTEQIDKMISKGKTYGMIFFLTDVKCVPNEDYTEVSTVRIAIRNLDDTSSIEEIIVNNITNKVG